MRDFRQESVAVSLCLVMMLIVSMSVGFILGCLIIRDFLLVSRYMLGIWVIAGDV